MPSPVKRRFEAPTFISPARCSRRRGRMAIENTWTSTAVVHCAAEQQRNHKSLPCRHAWTKEDMAHLKRLNTFTAIRRTCTMVPGHNPFSAVLVTKRQCACAQRQRREYAEGDTGHLISPSFFAPRWLWGSVLALRAYVRDGFPPFRASWLYSNTGRCLGIDFREFQARRTTSQACIFAQSVCLPRYLGALAVIHPTCTNLYQVLHVASPRFAVHGSLVSL